MSTVGGAPWADALAKGIRSMDPDAALSAGLAGIRAKVPPLEVARAAAGAYAEAVDVTPDYPPHGLLALSAGVRLSRHLPPKAAPLPVLQALGLAAADGKVPASNVRGLTTVTGEISHLTRSFEYAVRTGAFEDAVAIFGGLLREGRERVMAGDVLFRLAAEDMSVGGHKLMIAGKSWQLAAALGWRGGHGLMAPAVSRVARGLADTAAFRTAMGVWGREKVDLEAVGGNAAPADEGRRARVRAALGAKTPEECAKGVIASLQEGVSLDGLAHAVLDEASRRAAASETYNVPLVRAVIFADLARWVLRFSKTATRLYPVLQAALLVNGTRGGIHPLGTTEGLGEDELLVALEKDLEARSAKAAVTHAHTYLAKGGPRPRLVQFLVGIACRDAPAASNGHVLLLADAAAEEALLPGAPATEPLVALARTLALAPRDRRAWEGPLREFSG